MLTLGVEVCFAKCVVISSGILHWKSCESARLALDRSPVCSHRIITHAYFTNVSLARKRKLDELFTDSIKDDPKYLSSNTMAAPCRANGLRGIYNMGATCFMSVILQSLVHNPLLRNYYLSDSHQTGTCLLDNCLSCAMDELFQDFYAQDSISGYSASKILFNSWHAQQSTFPHLAGNDEQDAHEFFQFLMEEVHQNAQTPRIGDVDGNVSRPILRPGSSCNCIVHQTFYGKLQSTLTCQRCESVTTAVEPFLDLSLGLEDIGKKNGGKSGRNIPKTSQVLTLQRLLDDYQSPERCEYTCHRCDSTQDAKKQLSIKRLPNVLCIQLKVCRVEGQPFEMHSDKL